MKKNISLTLTSLFLTFSMCFSAQAENLHSSWAESYVSKALEYNIIPEFMKDDDLTQNITREEFCELAYLTVNEVSNTNSIVITYSSRETHFYDTDNKAVTALKRMGIISGKTSTKFDPDGLITREEAASILDRMVEEFELTKFVNNDGFKDRKEISSWAKESVNTVCGMNIMNGMGNGNFDPQGYYTKEQAVSTMIRFINNFPDEESREKIDNSKYYVSNEYYRWIEDENKNVIFKLPASKYNDINFYSNGKKALAFAVTDNTTDAYDIESGRKLFSIPALVVGTSSDKYIIAGVNDLYGIYDFNGKELLPIQYDWDYLYSEKYVTTNKDA